MLQVDDVTVTFGGVRALDDVGMTVEAGQITGLIGPNGAGKTTLFNVITGLQRPNRGNITIDGRDATGLKTRQRAKLGLGRTFQRLEIFGSLSVRENILVALENRGVRGRQARAESDALLDRVGLVGLADSQADVLPTGMARLLELGRALACDPKILLLDEPSSGLNGPESDRLGELLEELSAAGIAVLLVEHDMGLVMKVCRHIYVLNFGRMIAEGAPADIRAHPDVQAAYLGTAAA